MSETKSITDISEFFNDDDSEGLRFMDFIRKRGEGIRKQKYLFMDCETDRMSFEVQLEKLPTPQLKKSEEEEHRKLNEKARNTQLPADLPTEENVEFSIPQAMPPRSRANVNKSPIRSARSNRKPTIRKSIILLSPSDNLRRFSIKNSTVKKLAGGRRTLLQEFESTVETANFNPPICSTPISQPIQNVSQASVSNKNLTENVNTEQLNIVNNPITSGSCCGHTDTLMKTLLRKDAELKEYMGSMLDKTLKQINDQSKSAQNSSADNATINSVSNCTPLKRTFTVEKGSIPGQFVLTSDKSNHQVSDLQQSPTTKNRTKSNVATSQHSRQNVCYLSQLEVGKILNSHSKKLGQRKSELQNTQKQNYELPNSSHNSLHPIILTHNAEMPESHNTLLMGSVREPHVLIIPVNQTASTSKNEKDNTNSKNPQVNTCPSTVENIEQAADNLKLTDILTDDEDAPLKSTLQSAQYDIDNPLNLVSKSYGLRKKHLRKRSSSRQKLRNDNSQQLTSETDGEKAPPAGGNRRTLRRKYNSPPGAPLNGEMYAKELARMSNYEILDLRKRNSMGQIFAILGRRSRRSLEEVNKKKNELDDQIEQELLKRNLDNIIQNSICHIDQENIENVSLHVPYNFRDSLTAQKRDQNILKDSSFIDEKSSDRVKFKSDKETTRLSKEKVIPKILKEYLEVSKKYSKRKKKSTNNMTKRSLFNTQSLIEPNERDSLTAERTPCSRFKKLSIPYLKSPPTAITSTSEMQNTPIKTQTRTVVTSTTTSKTQNTSEKVHAEVVACSTTTDNVGEHLTLPPPPPGFESDSATSPNKNTNQYATNVTLEVGTKNYTIHNNFNANCDDNLFKKPVNPPPKRAYKKKFKTVKVPQESATDNQGSSDGSGNGDLTDGGSLRRSKRGHIPLCIPPLVVAFQQQEIKRQERSEKTREMRKKKQKQEEKNVKKLKKAETKKTKSTSTKTKNSTIKIDGAESQKDNTLSNKNNHCSRLEFNPPPPIEYLNNVFDQLKQNSITANTTVHPIAPQHKVKPFKIRVCRLTPSETASTTSGTTVSSTTVSSTSTCSSTNSNTELVSWLKNIGEACSGAQQMSHAFKDAKISFSKDLRFIELQGVEYAFYDTADKAFLGYLRFKPRQRKSKKKAKRYELNFVNLLGLFRITVDHDEHILSVGDMIVVEKMAYYDIENLVDDIGMLMVIKK